MTGLIAATSPLPESVAFHNGVTGRPRLCSEALRALGGIGFRAAFLDARGVPATARFRAIIVSAWASNTEWGGSRTLCANPTLRVVETTMPNAYPSGCHKASQHIPIVGSESGVG
jgi:hypothetical protein